MSAMAGYSDDLAYIHDAGFGGFAVEAAPGLLSILRRNGIEGGLVVDLGCGSGIWARELVRAGYEALGIDISESMVRIARRKAPGARFIAASLFEASLPPCVAVTAIGECVNYAFDPANRRSNLNRFFRRVFEALRPGGVFVFDAAEPGQDTGRVWRTPFRIGHDWAVLVEASEDRRRRTLTRRIVSFRRRGRLYRRTDEAHVLRLYGREELSDGLARAGFRVLVMQGYGSLQVPADHVAIAARKPKR